MIRVQVLLLSVVALLICLPHETAAAPPLALGDADVVPYQHWEFWLSGEYVKTENKEIYKMPVLEIIYGVVPRVEVGVEGTYIIEKEDGNTTRGVDCVAIQPKVLLLEEKESLPAIAASVQYEAPTDENKTRLDWPEHTWAYSLTAQKTFGKTLAAAKVKYFADDKWKYGADLVYELNDKLKLLGEVYAITYIDSEKKDELNFRAGLKRKITENAKVYFAAGRSLLTVAGNRPLFEADGGIMMEF